MDAERRAQITWIACSERLRENLLVKAVFCGENSILLYVLSVPMNFHAPTVPCWIL